MKHDKVLSIILAFVLVAQISLYNAMPVSASENRRYGYECLKTDSQRYAYDTVVEGIRSFDTEIDLDQSKKLTSEDLVYVRDMIYADYPEFFWFAGSYDYSHLDGIVAVVMPHYSLNISGTAVTEPNQDMLKAVYQVETATDAIVEPIKNLTDYEKALYLYEYVSKTLEYEDTANDQNLYGAVVEGAGVCSAYARMYQYLLLKSGIKAWWVSGEAVNSKGVRESHAWTVLWIDGKCYCADITWDDGDDKLFHSYFLKSIEEFNENHFPRDPYAQVLPQQCGHGDLDYYTVYAGKLDGVGIADQITSAEQLADVFQVVSLSKSEVVYRAKIQYSGDDFSGWFQNVSQSMILKKLNLKSGKMGWSHLGGEYQVTISGVPVSMVSIPADGVTLLTGQAQLGYLGQRYWIGGKVTPDTATNKGLHYVSSDPGVVSVDPETGVVMAVSAGTASVSVQSADSDMFAVCTVTVTAAPSHFHDPALEKVDQIDATCTQKGTMLHYKCNGCNGLFLDQEGDKEVLDPSILEIAALGHAESEWKYAKDEHFRICTRLECSAEIPGSREAHTDDTCDTCGYRKGDSISELPTDKDKLDVEALAKNAGGVAALIIVLVLLGKLFRRRK